MKDILDAAMYSLIFLGIAFAALYLAWFVLDVLTPNTKLGQQIAGFRATDGGLAAQEGSHSAALVSGVWLLMQGLIIFTAIWTNAHGTDFWSAVGWMSAFSIYGVVLQSVAFWLLDRITPGSLGELVCEPGPTTALAKLTAFEIVTVGLVVIAVIS